MRYLVALLSLLILSCVTPREWNNNVRYFNQTPISWPQSSFPIELVADIHLSANEVAALEHAAAIWNAATEREVFSHIRVIDLWESPELLSPRRNTIYVHEADLPDRPNITIQGFAHVRRDFATITHAYVVLDVAVSDLHAPAVLVHELGHTLGLSHDDDPRSIMYYSAVQSEQYILEDDVKFIQWEIDSAH